MIVYFAGPMSISVPSASLRPPNSVCQYAYESTATRVPAGGTSSAAVKKRPITGLMSNIFQRSAPLTATRISVVDSPVPMATLFT